ncbi:MAG: Fe-S cluster assembly protein SufD [Rhodothalassiaceae bacterium]
MTMIPSSSMAAFDEAWDIARSGLPGGGWLQEMRAVAFNRFRQLGLPSPRDEAWRYADLRPLARARFSAETEARIPDPVLLARAALPDHEGPCLVFVNGRLSLAASRLSDLPPGMTLKGLRQTLTFGGRMLEPVLAELRDGDAFDQLNTALLSDGCLIEMKEGAGSAHPVSILHILEGEDAKAVATRSIIRLGKGASLDLVESFVGSDTPFFSSAIAQIDLADGATLRLMRRQKLGEATTHVARSHVRMDAAHFAMTGLASGGLSAREELRVALSAPGGEASFDFAQVADGPRTLDCHVVLDHLVPDCTSRQRYRGVLGRGARGSIESAIHVRKDAQRTDARQHLQSLLLDRSAEANAKPELRIHADDVVCAHGATVGEIDRDQLFYLVSRGIPPERARHLLIEGFVAGLFADLGDAALERVFLDDLAAALSSGGQGS